MSYTHIDDVVRDFGVPYVSHGRSRRPRAHEQFSARAHERFSAHELELARSALAQARSDGEATTDRRNVVSSSTLTFSDAPLTDKSSVTPTQPAHVRLEVLRRQQRVAYLEREKARLEQEERKQEREHQLALERIRIETEEKMRAEETDQQQIERTFREQRLLEEAQAEKIRTEAALAEKIESLECILCLQATASLAFARCGHLCACEDCIVEEVERQSEAKFCGAFADPANPAVVAKAVQCPVCRRRDQNVIKICVA